MTSCKWYVITYVTICVFVMSYVTSVIFEKFLMFFYPLLTNDDVCYVMMSDVAMLTML